MCFRELTTEYGAALEVTPLSPQDRELAINSLAQIAQKIIAACTDRPIISPNEVKNSSSERTRTIEVIYNDPAIEHYCYSYTQHGQGLIGRRRNLVTEQMDAADQVENPLRDNGPFRPGTKLGELVYSGFRTKAFPRPWYDGPHFKATVLKENIIDPTRTSYSLIFLDDTVKWDTRPGKITTYNLTSSCDNQNLAAIDTDPRIMIDLFRQTFPGADRSNGTLELGEIPIQEFTDIREPGRLLNGGNVTLKAPGAQ